VVRELNTLLRPRTRNCTQLVEYRNTYDVDDLDERQLDFDSDLGGEVLDRAYEGVVPGEDLVDQLYFILTAQTCTHTQHVTTPISLDSSHSTMVGIAGG